MYSNSTPNLNLIVGLIVLIVIVGRIAWRKFSIGGIFRNGRSNIDITSLDSSAIISYYTAGHNLINAKKGSLNGMSYSMLVTMPLQKNSAIKDIPFTKAGAFIYTLDLPFNTETHLVGLSKKYEVDALEFETFLRANDMAKINLEGDFSDYYDLYASQGQDFQARYVLDPEAMEFVVDYCRTNFWEICGSELYFVITNDQGGNTNVVTESQKFVEQIKPALLPGDPNAPPVHHEAPYGEYDGPPLPCPVCGKNMTMTDNWQACPMGHGVLINGLNLEKVHNHELNLVSEPDKAQPHGPINCPNCKNVMAQVNYQNSGIMIDSCEHCPFRWLDSDDIEEITSGKVKENVEAN